MSDRAKFADKAIDALGGTLAVAEMFALDQRVVSNWRTRGFPRDIHAAMTPMLTALGFAVSGELFRQRALEILPPPAPPAPPPRRRARAKNGKRAARKRRA